METNKTQDKAPLDLAKMFKTLWNFRKLYITILLPVAICTYLIIICIPRYYTCSIELAPEGDNTGSNTLNSLASSFGFSGLGKLGSNNDAISPLLYPDLLKSPNFIVQLFPINIKTKDGSLETTYYEYMKKHQKAPFWIKYIVGPIKALFTEKEKSNNKGTEPIKVMNMTKEQQDVAGAIIGNILCNVDKKTDAITLTVKDQDPLVCAVMADSIMNRMQMFIIEYRTKKARNDYNYYKKLCDEAKAKYEKARQRYASMSDANTDVTLVSVSSKINDLENDMQLLYNAYSALATQTQLAKTKIQENTPAFTPISTAVTPIKPAGPKRTLITLAITFLTAIVLSVYILTRPEKKK